MEDSYHESARSDDYRKAPPRRDADQLRVTREPNPFDIAIAHIPSLAARSGSALCV